MYNIHPRALHAIRDAGLLERLNRGPVIQSFARSQGTAAVSNEYTSIPKYLMVYFSEFLA